MYFVQVYIIPFKGGIVELIAQMFTARITTNEINGHTLFSYHDLALRKAGFGVLGFTEFHFKGDGKDHVDGWTGLWLLSESHLAIHTFGQQNCSYIELSSCVDTYYIEYLKLIRGEMEINKVVEILETYWEPTANSATTFDPSAFALPINKAA